jgi:hypothetical protein
MKTLSLDHDKTRWLTVVTFAVAMAWVESAVVFYLRTHIDRIVPYQNYPLPVVGGFGFAELVREFATLVMLLTVGILAGKTWRARIGYSAIAFGVWDVFYYVFLKIMCDWPSSLMDWDILFLIPLPWWGPVLAPVLIAMLMIVWGTLATQSERPPRQILPSVGAWSLNLIGMALALYVFMADTLQLSAGGLDTIRRFLPTYFNWPLFCVALALMSAPVIRELTLRRSRVETTIEPARAN